MAADMLQRAVTAGGNICGGCQDHGFVYGHGIQDRNGHAWELAFMKPGARGHG